MKKLLTDVDNADTCRYDDGMTTNSTKVVTCNRCGESNLRWAQSKKGNWYLTPIEGARVYGENGNVIKTIAVAHRCRSAEEVAHENARIEAMTTRDAMQAQLDEMHARIPMTADAIECRKLLDDIVELSGQLAQIKNKFDV